MRAGRMEQRTDTAEQRADSALRRYVLDEYREDHERPSVAHFVPDERYDNHLAGCRAATVEYEVMTITAPSGRAYRSVWAGITCPHGERDQWVCPAGELPGRIDDLLAQEPER